MKKNSENNITENSKSSNLQRKQHFHRRTQSNSDFSSTPQNSNILTTLNRFSIPLQQNSEKTILKTASLTDTNIQTTNAEPQPVEKPPNEEKQVIIETLDLTPQEQLKLAGTAGHGSITPGFFRFGNKKKTMENCPKFMELMMGFSPSNDEEKKDGNIEEIDISPLKEHSRNISTNFNRINEESMETESNISKRSSLCCKLSISKQKRESFIRSDYIEAIEEILQAEDGKKKIMIFSDKLLRKKKGHSKSCLSFNLHSFNLKLKNYIESKKSMSIRKNEVIFSDSHSKMNSSQTNSMMNYSHSQQKRSLRKKSDESWMINNLNSSITKHKKTNTSVFNPLSKQPLCNDKQECMAQIQLFDKKIKEMEKTIGILQSKTNSLEKKNQTLSEQILDAVNEKKVREIVIS